jgi:glutamine amidotransferase
MIGVIDYGAGNLLSVTNALDFLGLRWTHAHEPAALKSCGRVVLPGVGHFKAAMRRLVETGMADAVITACREGRPLLGVCLGAQLLFDASDEAPEVSGLGILAGRVVRLQTKTIPHMGWNRTRPVGGARLFDYQPPYPFFYYAHSYVCQPVAPEQVAAESDSAGQRFCVAVQAANVHGVQFHPEKSGQAGLALLRRFATC